MKMNRSFLHIGALACALALGAWPGVPVHAGRTYEMTVSGSQKRTVEPLWEGRRGPVTRSVKVAYGDLNLQSQAGAQEFYLRLRRASKDACGPRHAQLQELRREWGQCVAATLDRSVAATGLARVVAMHHETTGRDVSTASKLAGSP